MNSVNTVEVECPYCGSFIEIRVESNSGVQEYTEDCPVCCRPIALSVRFEEEGSPQLAVRRENE